MPCRRLPMLAATLPALLLMACGQPESTLSPAQEAALLNSSQQLADRFQQDLLAALKSAIAAGGPVGAIDTCTTVAPAIAAQLSDESGATVRRTALRVRNPASKPDAFERETMSAWIRGPVGSDGKPAERFQAYADEQGAPQVRWMRAIPTGDLCVTCHGSAIAPDVEAAIAARYPDDRATGFAPGDLRGAFSISWAGPAVAQALRKAG